MRTKGVLMDEIKKITKRKLTLPEFHYEVSKALNLALIKIEMHSPDDSSAIQQYATQEASRTFILGLNSKYASGTLYSHNSKDLETAYAIASAISHDNANFQFVAPQYSNQKQYSNLQHHFPPNRKYHDDQRRHKPNVQVHYTQREKN